MSKNRLAAGKLQILSAPYHESHQLDLLSFVSDYALADLSLKAKQTRTTIAQANVTKAKVTAFHYEGNLDHNKTFSNFCLGDSNQFAVEALKRFIASERSDFGIIFLKAGSGLGKSHILHAVANELHSQKKSFYLSSPLMMSAFIDHFNALKSYDYLLLDDLEEIEANAELQKILCQLIDYAQSGKMKLIIAGAKLPKDLSGCDDRFKGKLSAALIHHIAEMNNVLAYKIVESKCLAMNLNLAKNVKELVSNQFLFNGYGLESALHKFKSTSSILGQEITLEMARQELKAKERLELQDDLQGFLETIANGFQVRVEDLISPLRKKEVALARHAAMFILKEKKGLGLMRISEIFGKDHSSVIYAVARMRKLLESDLQLRKKLQNIIDSQHAF